MEVRLEDVIINVDKRLAPDEVGFCKSMAHLINLYLKERAGGKAVANILVAGVCDNMNRIKSQGII